MDLSTLLGTMKEYNYEAVQSWATSIPGGDLFKLEQLFCPIHYWAGHWAFLERLILGSTAFGIMTRFVGTENLGVAQSGSILTRST